MITSARAVRSPMWRIAVGARTARLSPQREPHQHKGQLWLGSSPLSSTLDRAGRTRHRQNSPQRLDPKRRRSEEGTRQ